MVSLPAPTVLRFLTLWFSLVERLTLPVEADNHTFSSNSTVYFLINVDLNLSLYSAWRTWSTVFITSAMLPCFHWISSDLECIILQQYLRLKDKFKAGLNITYSFFFFSGNVASHLLILITHVQCVPMAVGHYIFGGIWLWNCFLKCSYQQHHP